MDEKHFFSPNSGGDWRNRSPDADQEYFIDKMQMLKIRLRKYEEVSTLGGVVTSPVLNIILEYLYPGESPSLPLLGRTKVGREGGVARQVLRHQQRPVRDVRAEETHSPAARRAGRRTTASSTATIPISSNECQ